MKFSKRLRRDRTLKIEIQEESENRQNVEVEEDKVAELQCEVGVVMTGTDEDLEKILVTVTTVEV